MAFTYGFYNSLRGDRKYNAEQVSELFDGILADGIIPNIGQLFVVQTASNGMQITVGTGRAWFDHTWSKNDSVMVLNVPESDITRPRYDAVVLEVNHEEATRANAIKIVTGVPEVNPVKPTLVNTDKVHQYPLAYILVPAAAEEIVADNIENMVGRSPTVFASGILRPVPIDDLWDQWQGEWQTWFNSIKLQLSGDIVTNLQYQIDALSDRVEIINQDIGMIKGGLALVKVVVKDTNNKPVSDVMITNMTYTNGDNVYTNDQGIAQALVSKNSAFKPTFPTYMDVQNFNSTAIELIAGSEYTINVTATRRNFLKMTSSSSIQFTGNCTKCDFSIVGGGGGGGGFQTFNSSYNNTRGAGGGGGGGGVTYGSIVPIPRNKYKLTVGAGGAAVSHSDYYPDSWGTGNPAENGGDGGDTVFEGFTAKGGKGGGGGGMNASQGGAGGSGGGAGGRGLYTYTNTSNGALSTAQPTSGQNGSKPYYISFTESSEYGPGGGGGGGPRGGVYYTLDNAGQIGGGRGSSQLDSSYGNYSLVNGSDGGGGGGSIVSGTTAYGKGGKGFGAFRMYY